MIQTIIQSEVKDKSIFVNHMFAKIAYKYDLLNNLMTFGMHKAWKEKTIKLALKEKKDFKNAIDLCSGTGNLAMILNKYCPQANITCIDNCNEMLDITKNKLNKLKLKNISLKLLDIEKDDLKNHSADLITIGFGLRNLVNKERCIEIIYKILSKGGVLACIDLGHPTNRILEKVFYYYFFKIIPKLGEIFAKDKDAYTYLPTSLLSWYKQEELKDLLLQKGFKKCFYKNVFGGIIAIHIAVK
ncbi:MAG: ubiquinone/menaquinone biosynthesis methyltransferase [Candidatus Melainabacteria bacterium]|nr:ubiquinone/menaquinone biosynthesis methyltransferase [Candidatus Melainabacteria bacterium]